MSETRKRRNGARAAKPMHPELLAKLHEKQRKHEAAEAAKTPKPQPEHAERERQLGEDRHGVPIRPGCVVLTDDSCFTLVVTDVKGDAIIGEIISDNQTRERPDPNSIEHWADHANQCEVVDVNLRETLDQVLPVQSQGMGAVIPESTASESPIGSTNPKQTYCGVKSVEQATKICRLFIEVNDRFHSLVGLEFTENLTAPRDEQDEVLVQRMRDHLAAVEMDLAEFLSSFVHAETNELRDAGWKGAA